MAAPSAQYFDADGKPIILSPDKMKPLERKAATYEDINGNPLDENFKPLQEGKLKKPEEFKSPVTAATETAAPWLGRATVEALPAIGSLLGVGGTLIGTGVKQKMKQLRPDLFGEQPTGFDAATDTAKELALNNLAPGAVKAGAEAVNALKAAGGMKAAVATKFSNFPAVREALVQRMTGQLVPQAGLESEVIHAGAAQAAEKAGQLRNIDQLNSEIGDEIARITGRSQVEDPIGSYFAQTFGKNSVGKMMLQMNKEAENFAGDIARTQTYKQISNTTLSDLAHVQNAKISAGSEFTNDIALNKILTSYADPAKQTLDAPAALRELLGKNKEIYTEAFDPGTYEGLKSTLEKMAELEKENVTDRILSFSNRRLMWNLMGGVGLGTLLHGGTIPLMMVGAAKAEAPVLTNVVLRQLMKNPETVKLVQLALDTPATSQQAPLISRALAGAVARIYQGAVDLAAVPNR